MLSTAIIIFRETLEIAMIIGIVLAATRGLSRRTTWVMGGITSGALGAGLVAYFASSISSSLEGTGQEIFNAAILFSAAILIGWTVVWMHKHARQMTAHLKKIGHEVTEGHLPLYSLSVIIGLAVLREGAEIVLFIYGMILSGQDSAAIVAGTSAGLLLGLISGVLLYFGLLKIPARHALKVTSWLLILLVAGLASQGAGYLSAAGYFSDFSKPVWDTSWLLSENGIVGKSLHGLIGYSAHPTAIQILFYLATLSILLSIITTANKRYVKNALVLAAVFFAFTKGGESPAFAIDHFYSPIVSKGEIEIEYVGNRTFDRTLEKNNIQGHEVELEYGVTDWWKAILSEEFAKEPGDSLKVEATQLESVFQFTQQGEYWVDTGLLAAYAFAKESDAPDAMEVKLLLQKDMGKFTHLANVGFEQTVGKHSGGTGGPNYSVMWSSRYRYSEYVQPGFEIHSGLGQGPKLDKYGEQEHYVGPALYGRLFDHFKYEAAYLFGASHAASQGAARMVLEYEMRF